MIRFLRPAAVGVVGFALLAAAADAQKFKTGTDTVALFVTVMDGDKRLVPDLVQEDFEVYDNGKPQTILLFDNRPTPISVVVMLDTSGSMTLTLDLVKQAAEQFLIRLLPEDQGRVGAFNDKIEFHPENGFTSDRDVLIQSLKELDFGYPTRLYDAIDESLAELSAIQGRKVVLVFTDGDDTSSKVKGSTVLERSRAEEAMVYSIGIETVYFNGQQKVRTSPDRGLRRLSDETGGGFYLLKKTDELGPTFTRVAQELHSQYLIGFAPSTDGKVHKLEVRVKRPGLTARARRTYLAPTSTSSPVTR